MIFGKRVGLHYRIGNCELDFWNGPKNWRFWTFFQLLHRQAKPNLLKVPEKYLCHCFAATWKLWYKRALKAVWNFQLCWHTRAYELHSPLFCPVLAKEFARDEWRWRWWWLYEVMVVVAVFDVSPVNVWCYAERSDADASWTLSRATVTMDTDSTLGGDSAIKRTSNRRNLSVRDAHAT